MVRSLRYHDDIVRLQENVVFWSFTLYNVLIVKRVFCLSSVFDSQNVNVFDSGEWSKPTRTRQCLKHGHIGQKRQSAGSRDFPSDKDSAAVDRRNSHSNLWIGKIFGQSLANHRRKLHGRKSSGL